MKKCLAVVMVVFLVVPQLGSASALQLTISNGQKCLKSQIGKSAKTNTRTFVCTKSAKGQVWRLKTKNVSGSTGTSISIPVQDEGKSVKVEAPKSTSTQNKVTSAPNPTSTTMAPPSNAKPVKGDLAGPVIASASVNPNSVDVSNGPATLTLTSNYVDESGMASSVAWASSGISGVGGQMPRISGDAKNGTYQLVVTVPQGTRPGTYNATFNGFTDILGNAGQSFQVSYNVANSKWGNDLAGPVIASASVNPNSVDVSNGPATLTLTSNYVDESGMASSVAWASSGISGVGGQMPRISGDAKNGTYQLVVTVPQGTRPGTYNATFNGFTDILGNAGQSFQVGFTVINTNWGA